MSEKLIFVGPVMTKVTWPNKKGGVIKKRKSQSLPKFCNPSFSHFWEFCDGKLLYKKEENKMQKNTICLMVGRYYMYFISKVSCYWAKALWNLSDLVLILQGHLRSKVKVANGSLYMISYESLIVTICQK